MNDLTQSRWLPGVLLPGARPSATEDFFQSETAALSTPAHPACSRISYLRLMKADRVVVQMLRRGDSGSKFEAGVVETARLCLGTGTLCNRPAAMPAPHHE